MWYANKNPHAARGESSEGNHAGPCSRRKHLRDGLRPSAIIPSAIAIIIRMKNKNRGADDPAAGDTTDMILNLLLRVKLVVMMMTVLHGKDDWQDEVVSLIM